ncbi:related to protein tyrosine phosphatase PPS1 [Serendipita indica DSM 11827]|uniref:Related to protein tyrosine phosphatase PPS1 n=1 Tax=Serendipita indica (strain DSM 11827) TaxID=1109443 RepID=G4TS26_SERID|nr:related to protein tyrosine phosphatase PPS1 [Serendipita indica DSM 11827]
MSSSGHSDTANAEPAGLKYPPRFLSSLPILLPRPAPFAPIRALTAAQFAEIHTLYSLADEDLLGDSTLFPFLHGIEGNNLSQNTFFANASRGLLPAYAQHPLLPPVNPTPKVPEYRGLIWVRADDLDGPGHASPGLVVGRDDFEMHDSSHFDEDEDEQLSDNSQQTSEHAHEATASNPPAAGSIAIAIPGRSARSASTSTTSYSSSEVPISPSTAPTSLPTSPSSAHCGSTPFSSMYSNLLTSTLRAEDLLTTCADGPCFVPPRVPDGISLRNFGIQVPIYATLSDVVIYSPRGMTRASFALAERFKHAIEAKARERERYGKGDIVHYNVFVITDPFSEFENKFPHLVAWDSIGRPIQYVDFAAREREEICNLTQATEVCDGLWLGNSNDVPSYQNGLLGNDPFTGATQNNPQGFDICIECCDGTHFPTSRELESVENHLRLLDELWVSRWQQDTPADGKPDEPPVRPPPSANHILHLAFPSSPIVNQHTVSQLIAFIAFLQGLLYPEAPQNSSPTSASGSNFFTSPGLSNSNSNSGSFPPSSSSNSVSFPHHRRDESAGSNKSVHANRPLRKCKILLYSSDGYTETSILALCLLMARKPSHFTPMQSSMLSAFVDPTSVHPDPEGTHHSLHRTHSATVTKTYLSGGGSSAGMSLPEAYLELQIARGRSFYVYPTDLDLLKRAEARLYVPSRNAPKERGRDREVTNNRNMTIDGAGGADNANQSTNGFSRWKWSTWGSRASFSIPAPPPEEDEAPASSSNTAAMVLSSSTPNSALVMNNSSGALGSRGVSNGTPKRRARASTSPMPQVWADHWAWFSDPRFDGSFPSRVLPFLYLGNLAHASNAYMLHALGITHVVSVGECALVPPQGNTSQAAEYRFSYGGKVLGAGPGSLWIEEREGRIKGVSDDGIDSLRPRFREVCDWIDAARQEGGKVLVHCRVGVSRSATVTIAYVMKHMGMSLVDAYLLVRSRRLSVLIQPNLRLLYNLSSWEAEIARERFASEGEQALHAYLSRRLSWPYLAREVHLLNEKYIQ